jgi:hypothetical protein
VVEQAARPIFADLTAALEEASVALAAGDPARAESALWHAREIDVRVAGLREALDTGYETARLSPSRRHALKRLAPYAEAADSLDLAERNDLPTSVLVGQVRSAAVDLLRASGMHLDEAAGELDGAVRAASGNQQEHPGGLAGTAA